MEHKAMFCQASTSSDQQASQINKQNHRGNFKKGSKNLRGMVGRTFWHSMVIQNYSTNFNRQKSIFTSIWVGSSHPSWDRSPNCKISIASTCNCTYSGMPATNHPVLQWRCMCPHILNQEMGTSKGVPKHKEVSLESSNQIGKHRTK